MELGMGKLRMMAFELSLDGDEESVRRLIREAMALAMQPFAEVLPARESPAPPVIAAPAMAPVNDSPATTRPVSGATIAALTAPPPPTTYRRRRDRRVVLLLSDGQLGREMTVDEAAKLASVEPKSLRIALTPSAMAVRGGRVGGHTFRWADQVDRSSPPEPAAAATTTAAPVNGAPRGVINPAVIGAADRPPMPEHLAKRYGGDPEGDTFREATGGQDD
jgi:hypothetical protein